MQGEEGPQREGRFGDKENSKEQKGRKQGKRRDGGERGEASLKGEREGEESSGGLGAFNGEFSKRSVLVQFPSLLGYLGFSFALLWLCLSFYRRCICIIYVF